MAEETKQEEQWQDDPDVQLMIRVRNGDATAFEELMLRNQGRVLSVIRNLVGDLELAEDLTQEVFLRVYRAREKYSPTAQFSTWLYRIVHNLTLNALRFRKRHQEVLFGSVRRSSDSGQDSGDTWSMEDTLAARSGLMPTRQVASKETQAVVREAIDSLGERQRMAILLHRFEGMNYEQIGSVMSLSPQAVKSLLCRARVHLRELLMPYMDEEGGETS